MKKVISIRAPFTLCRRVCCCLYWEQKENRGRGRERGGKKSKQYSLVKADGVICHCYIVNAKNVIFINNICMDWSSGDGERSMPCSWLDTGWFLQEAVGQRSGPFQHLQEMTWLLSRRVNLLQKDNTEDKLSQISLNKKVPINKYTIVFCSSLFFFHSTGVMRAGSTRPQLLAHSCLSNGHMHCCQGQEGQGVEW